MKRERVTSSNIFAVGHDGETLEVEFHGTGCACRKTPKKGEQRGACDCSGGDVWQYGSGDQPFHPRHHQAMMSSASFGSHFMAQVKPNWTGRQVHKEVRDLNVSSDWRIPATIR